MSETTEAPATFDADYELNAREWFKQFRAFVKERDPIHCVGEDGNLVKRGGTDATKDAEAIAVAACHRAIAVMAARFIPGPTFSLDVTRAGRG